MSQKLNEFFLKSSPEEYPYLRVNLRPDSPHSIMVITNDLIRDKEYAKLGLPLKPVKLFTFH